MIQDPQKKIYVLIFGIGVLLIMLFFVWRNFFGRGEITITAKASYSLTIWKQNVTTNRESYAQLPSHAINCAKDRCSVPADSGNYTILIQKENFQPEYRQIKVPLGGSYSETIEFRALPSVKKIGKRDIFILPAQAKKFSNLPGLSLEFLTDVLIELKNFPEKITDLVFGWNGKTAIISTEDKILFYQIGKAILTDLGLSAGTKIFYDQTGQAIFYVDQNKDNGRQTLYRRAVSQDGELGEKTMVTSFLRDLQTFTLSPSPDGNKISLVEKGASGMSIYLVDLIAKSRTNLLDASYIGDTHWFPDGSSFAFNARGKNETSDGAYLYLPSSQSLKKLSLNISLENAVVVNAEHIISAKIEKVPSTTVIQNIEGKAFETKEVESNFLLPGSEKKNEKSLLVFIDYSLTTGEKKLLKAFEDQPLPDAIELSSDGKSIYFLQRDELSILSLGDALHGT